MLYHHIGLEIIQSQKQHGWGSKIITQLSQDLRAAFPEMKGFGTRNLSYMRKLAEEYPDDEFVQQVVAQLPWGHNILLMDTVPDKQIRLFYIKNAIEHGWSRSRLTTQIETGLHKAR